MLRVLLNCCHIIIVWETIMLQNLRWLYLFLYYRLSIKVWERLWFLRRTSIGQTGTICWKKCNWWTRWNMKTSSSKCKSVDQIDISMNTKNIPMIRIGLYQSLFFLQINFQILCNKYSCNGITTVFVHNGKNYQILVKPSPRKLPSKSLNVLRFPFYISFP